MEKGATGVDEGFGDAVNDNFKRLFSGNKGYCEIIEFSFSRVP